MSGPGLMIQRCLRCGEHLFPERLACSRCASLELEPVPAGPGTVEDVTQILRAPSAAAEGPVVIAVVRLEKGPMVLARAQAEVLPGTGVELEDVAGAVLISPRSGRSR